MSNSKKLNQYLKQLDCAKCLLVDLPNVDYDEYECYLLARHFDDQVIAAAIRWRMSEMY